MALFLVIAALTSGACNAAPAVAVPPVAAPPSQDDAVTAEATDLPRLAPAAQSATPTELTLTPADTPASDTPEYTYRIVDSYPHDTTAWTQGLVYANNIFFEGTGLYGQSTLRKVDPVSGKVLFGIRLPDEVFGEGITLFDGKLHQLTWKEQTGFVVDSDTFELIETFHYPSEGWGLTHDSERLIMSDGTNRLTYLDPNSFVQIGQIEVFDGDRPIEMLNELEFIEGEIFANVWQTDRIVRISPENGQVTGWIDLSGLLSPEKLEQPIDVLNGIAYDAEGDRLFVTGKLWPEIFEIELVEVKE